MSGLTKFGLALILVFSLFLLALAVELLYVLWYRRRFWLASPGADNPELAAAVVEGEPRVIPNSKELLLYLLCWKNQSRIEPTSAAVTPGFPQQGSADSSTKLPPPAPSSSAEEDAEMAKWRGLYASRVLFTIREEEKEGSELDAGSARSVVGGVLVVGEKVTEEQVELGVVSDVQVAEEEEEEEEKDVCHAVMVGGSSFHFTPFSTPCASPPFYTPSPSPTRDLDSGVGVVVPRDTDSSDDELFSPAEEKLPLPLKAMGSGDGKRPSLS